MRVYGDLKTCIRQIYPTRLHLPIRASAAGRQRLRRQLRNENQIPYSIAGLQYALNEQTIPS